MPVVVGAFAILFVYTRVVAVVVGRKVVLAGRNSVLSDDGVSISTDVEDALLYAYA